MGKINIDLGAIFQTTGQKAPVANPYFDTIYDDDNNLFVDKSGNPIHKDFQPNGSKFNPNPDPTLRFTPLSDWSAAMHPDVAQYVAKQNTDYQQAQSIAQKQHDIELGIKGQDFQTGRAALAKDYSQWTPTEGAVLNPTNTAAGFNNTLGNQAEINYNVPRDSAIARSQEVQKQGREAFAFNSLNGPEWAGQSDANIVHNNAIDAANYRGNQTLRNTLNNLNLKYDVNDTSNRLAMQPETIDTQRNLGTAANIQSSGVLGAAPSEAQERIYNGLLKAGLSKQQADHAGMIFNTELNNLRTQAAYSAHPAPMNNIGQINPDGSLSRNPIAMTPTQSSMMAIQGMGQSGTQPTTISTGTGTHIIGPAPVNETHSTKTETTKEPIHPRVMEGQVPIKGFENEGYTTDNKGRIYYNGKDVTNSIDDGTPLKEAVMRQLTGRKPINPILTPYEKWKQENPTIQERLWDFMKRVGPHSQKPNN